MAGAFSDVRRTQVIVLDGHDQLARYRRIVEREWPDFSKPSILAMSFASSDARFTARIHVLAHFVCQISAPSDDGDESLPLSLVSLSMFPDAERLRDKSGVSTTVAEIWLGITMANCHLGRKWRRR